MNVTSLDRKAVTQLLTAKSFEGLNLKIERAEVAGSLGSSLPSQSCAAAWQRLCQISIGFTVGFVCGERLVGR